MLSEEAIEACENGSFFVVTVDTIVDAMEILTGLNWSGDKNSLEQRCLATLKHFKRLREHRLISHQKNGEICFRFCIFWKILF